MRRNSLNFVLGLAVALSLVFAAPSTKAAVLSFSTKLSGANEIPVAATPGTGDVYLTIDDTAKTMQVQVTFSNLVGKTTAAHIHCCTLPGFNAGVATQTPSFINFPLGVSSGTYNQIFDMSLTSSYRPAFITNNGGTVDGAFSVLLTGLSGGLAYFNIHTDVYLGGEIRGQLSPVPVPAALPLLGSCLAALGFVGWRRKHRTA